MDGQKLVVLKPLIWNDKGYLNPAGHRAYGGYVQKHGYGHEEWNARPEWAWKGYKVFHTESTPIMDKHAAEGNLCILMTAANQGRFYAVGVACNVYASSQNEMKQIAKAVGKYKDKDYLWDNVPIVRKKHNNNKEEFLTHWKNEYNWIKWRCPEDLFHWFKKPVEIIPNHTFPSRDKKRPRKAILKMHGQCMKISPGQAISIISPHLPKKNPIVRWLQEGDFVVAPTERHTRPNNNKQNKENGSASTASDPYTRYVKDMEITITPKHYKLQTDFEYHIEHKQKAKDVRPNRGWVDLRFMLEGIGLVLSEIKPCDNKTMRFAIRTAMGQLLDYSQLEPEAGKLLIVVSVKPSDPKDKDLALSNGFGLAYPERNGFRIVWPSD